MARPTLRMIAGMSCVAMLLTGAATTRHAAAQTNSSAPRGAAASSFRVGAAKVDITPTDLRNLNPFGGTWSGVHDPIFARIMVLDDGTNKAAVIATDLIEVGDTTDVRQRIERELGIPKTHITITASHDHSAPRAGSVTPGGIAHGETPESLAYTAVLYDKIVAGVKQAQASMQPARFGMGKGDVDININRDLYVEGKGWGQQLYNPNGVSDKTLWVLQFESMTGQPIAVLLNYAVHSTATLGSGMLSGDIGGEASRILEKRLGGNVVALYTMGSAGDQNTRYNAWQPVTAGGVKPEETHNAGQGGGGPQGGGQGGPPPPAPPPSAEVIAYAFDANHSQAFMLASEAARVVASMKDLTPVVRLRADERIVQCPVKQATNNSGNIVQKDVATMPLHLGLLMLNDTALTAVSGEVVTNIYWHLKRVSPLENTIMMTIANDRAGYIADDATYDTPTFQVRGTPFARGCAEPSIVNNLTQMIKQNQ